MSIDEFIKKYRGNYPNPHGQERWETWQDIDRDMKEDLKRVFADIVHCQESHFIESYPRSSETVIMKYDLLYKIEQL